MIIPDVNLLIYAYDQKMPQYDQARQWWEGLLNGRESIGLPWSVSTAFIRIMTNPRAFLEPASLTTALGWVDEWFRLPHVNPVNPGTRHLQILGDLLGDVGLGGKLVPDAHIAALAIEHQAKVHSNDNDFSRFSGLRWHNPL